MAEQHIDTEELLKCRADCLRMYRTSGFGGALHDFIDDTVPAMVDEINRLRASEEFCEQYRPQIAEALGMRETAHWGDIVTVLDWQFQRLRAENQRLKLAALTADRESMELDAENQRLQVEVARLKAANGHLQQELAMRPER